MWDLNNKYVGTKANKIKKISALNDYIVQQIDNNQEIKRFMRYLTESPLSSKSKDLGNNIISQPDLTTSLTKTSNEGLQCLFNGLFSEDIVTSQQNYIYVNTFEGRFDKVSGRLRVMINILVDDNREFLKYSEQSRSVEIASRIEEMLDMLKINNEYSEWLGNMAMELVEYQKVRLSKTNSINRTILVFNVNTVALR